MPVYTGVYEVPPMTGALVSVRHARLTAARQGFPTRAAPGAWALLASPWVVPTLQHEHAEVLLFLSQLRVGQGVRLG